MALKHRVIVEAAFASEKQRDVGMRVLRDFIEAWKATFENYDGRNRVSIAEHELPDARAASG